MSHTPGPWRANVSGIETDYEDYSKAVRVVRITMPRDHMGNAVDDARLIAAAPELLEACITVLQFWHAARPNFDRREPAYLETIRTVIRKATGEESLIAAIAKAEGSQS